MKAKIFEAVIGDRRFKVELSAVSGGGGGMFHLMINNFWYGQFVKRSGEWVYLPQKNNELTSDDIQVLIAMIKEISPS